MSVTKVQSKDQFQDLSRSNTATVVLFSADWAEQCNQVLDVMSLLGNQLGDKLQFANVAAEEFSEISLEYKVEAVPTVLFLKNGEVIDRIDGVDISALSEKCNKVAGAGKGKLEDRLRGLINKSKIMIFMKGDRNQPRCGFSKQLVQIMNEIEGIHYETFDILSDEDVRQGLKTFSNWPTYPQLYVNGELIGGLDIVKELKAGGELEETLKA